MNAQQIWEAICSLARSQGLYGRIRDSIIEAGKDEVLAQLEAMNFNDSVDMIMYFE